MKTPHRCTAIGLVLFSASLLGLAPQVAAQDHQAPPITSTTTEQANSNTAELNQAIDEAVDAGLIVTSGDPLTVDTREEAEAELTSQVTIIQKATEAYLTATATYQADERHYQDSLNQRSQILVENQALLAEYVQNTLAYQTKLNQYQMDKERYDQAKAAENQLMANYEADYQNHLILQKEWELEKALYDEKVVQAQAQTSQDGFLSQVHAQHLIFKSEPNAQVSFSGVDTFIAAHHDFGAGLSGIGNRASDVPHATTPHLSVGVGGATAAGSGNGYGLILKKNQPITVTYTNLEKSSYKDRPIRQVVYTYELTSTFAADNSATTFIYSDPTKTIYTGTGGENQGLVDFNIHQTITYYYDENEPVVLDPDSTALFSFASRNNTFEFGEQEYVRLGNNMTFIPITGSSVTGEDGYLAARGSNNSTADGSRLNRDDWDQDGHANEYYGAGVAKATGTTITFDFGIRYSQADINRSANPGRLRNGSRQWFTVNSDLKASGWLDSSLRPAPTPPAKPQLDTNLIEPIAPSKPILTLKSVPAIPKRPKAPDKPVIIYYPIKLSPQRSTVTPPKEPVTPTPRPAKASENRGSTGPQSSFPTNTTGRQPQTSVTVIYLPVVTNTNQWATPSTSPSPTRPTQPTTTSPRKPLTAYYKGETKADAYEKDLIPYPPGYRPNLFEKNVGVVDDNRTKEQQFIAFLKELEKEGQQKYSHLKGNKAFYQQAVNGYVFQGVAQGGGYHGSTAQKVFINFGEINYESTIIQDGIKILNRNHENTFNFPDIAHTGASLASGSPTGKLQDDLKTFLTGFPSLSSIWPWYREKIVPRVALMGNSFVGDIFSNMGIDDLKANMDSVILMYHPAFKNLPAAERLATYYTQVDLEAKRQELLLEVYDANPQKAKKRLSAEIIAISLLPVGLGAMAFGSRNPKKILGNVLTIDRQITGGQFLHTLLTPARSFAKSINNWSSIIQPIKDSFKPKPGQTLSNKTKQPTSSLSDPILPSGGSHGHLNSQKAKGTPKKPVTPSSGNSFSGPLLPSGGSNGVPSPKKPSKPKLTKPVKKPILILPQEDYPRLPSSNPIGRGQTKPSAPTKSKRPRGKTPTPGSSFNGPLLPSGGNSGVPPKPKVSPNKPKPRPNKPKSIHLPKKEYYPRLPTSNPIGRGAGKPQPAPKNPGKTPAPVSNYPLLPTSNPVNRGTVKPSPQPKTPPKPPTPQRPHPRTQPKPPAPQQPKPRTQPRQPAPPRVQPKLPQPRVQPRPPKPQPKPPQQPKRGKKR